MATASNTKLAMQAKEYFDRLAPIWDEEIGITEEKLTLLKNTVKDLGIEHASFVLDVGSGTGILLPLLSAQLGHQGRIIALDFSAQMLRRARAASSQTIVDFAQADAMTLPLSDSSVDVAICNNVFPHLDDKAKGLKDIARVLKRDGRLVICHSTSREAVNQIHQSIGGAVANHLLPDQSQLRVLIEQAGLEITHFEDTPERYLVTAKRATQGTD